MRRTTGGHNIVDRAIFIQSIIWYHDPTCALHACCLISISIDLRAGHESSSSEADWEPLSQLLYTLHQTTILDTRCLKAIPTHRSLLHRKQPLRQIHSLLSNPSNFSSID